MWNLQHGGGFAWAAVLVFASCSALRLARFNTMLEDQNAPKWTKGYFTGVPAPAGAGLAMLPLFLYLEFGESARAVPQLLALWMVISGALMVSRIPTLAMKGRRVSPLFVAPIMAVVCLIVAGVFTNTWLTLSILAGIYVLHIPYGWISYRRREIQEKAGK
jgi:CDP-diacylglycerol--serine O-phosphatidyltransferase